MCPRDGKLETSRLAGPDHDRLPTGFQVAIIRTHYLYENQQQRN